MTHEVRTIAHELGDVVGITQEILTFRHGALSIATPVKNQKAKTFIRKRSLRLPFFGARRERAVHEHNGRAGAPGVYEEGAHLLVLGYTTSRGWKHWPKYVTRFTGRHGREDHRSMQ